MTSIPRQMLTNLKDCIDRALLRSGSEEFVVVIFDKADALDTRNALVLMLQSDPSESQQTIAGGLNATFGKNTSAVNDPGEMVARSELARLREQAAKNLSEKQKTIAIIASALAGMLEKPQMTPKTAVQKAVELYDYVIANVK